MSTRLVRIVSMVIVCFVTIVSIVKSVQLVSANGAVDLRCRTVGARLLYTGHSPYFYKWHETDGNYILDPNDKPGRVVNGNVVTPAVLKTIHSLSTLPYGTVKIVWAVLQYCFFFGSILLLIKKEQQSRGDFFLPIVVVIACYLHSNVWFYNIERGQMYTFYLFIFCVIYRLANTACKMGLFMSGFINAAVIFIRPLTGVFLVAGVFKKDKKWMAGCVCGGIAGILLFVLPLTSQWKDYFSAMKVYSAEMNVKQQAVADTRHLPVLIEGQVNLQQQQSFACGGLSTVQYYLASRGIRTSSVLLAVFFLLAAACCSFLYLKTKPWLRGDDDIWLFAFLLYILAELFIIGYRAGYNQVEWVFGVFLICRHKKLSPFLLGAMLTAILMENVKLHFFRFQFELAEIILISILFYIVIAEKYTMQMRGKQQPINQV